MGLDLISARLLLGHPAFKQIFPCRQECRDMLTEWPLGKP
jgi:hypothetical protein